MTLLKKITADLAVFDSDDEKYMEVWTAEDSETFAAEQEELGDEAFAIVSLTAFIAHNGNCGFASSGSKAYVVNRCRDRAVHATVRVRWSQGINSGSYQRIKTIPAGGRVYLGCTRSGSIPVTDYNYSVVGAQVL